MHYYIHHNNQQMGPFTEAELKAKLASGEITAQDHVWWQGQQGWVPLSQTALAGAGAPAVTGAPVVIPGTAAAAAYPVGGVTPVTSKLAIWALVCGCLSFFFSLFTSIPAIILGHMALKETKQNPGIRGHGMALAGTILGYVFTLLLPVISIIAISVLIALGNQVKDTFKTIDAQLKAEATKSANQSATSPDQTTNSMDQSTPPAPTNSPDLNTNSAPSTNAPDSSTNAAPMPQ